MVWQALQLLNVEFTYFELFNVELTLSYSMLQVRSLDKTCIFTV